MTTGSQAERLDQALDELLAGSRPHGDRSLAPLLDAAALVREAMPPIPAGARFESRVLDRLEVAGGMGSAVATIERLARRELRNPVRILAAGAVSSAALGVTVTAFAVWRSRRHAAPAATGAGRK
ncbi:MAG TPA: hypothetical protein VFH98_07375 [Candidatus Limnocylindria bacterium]|jgi:hypothetical protein|nr:hypothetical protein [Candidatus Limnocylindria bacterium]